MQPTHKFGLEFESEPQTWYVLMVTNRLPVAVWIWIILKMCNVGNKTKLLPSMLNGFKSESVLKMKSFFCVFVIDKYLSE